MLLERVVNQDDAEYICLNHIKQTFFNFSIPIFSLGQRSGDTPLTYR